MTRWWREATSWLFAAVLVGSVMWWLAPWWVAAPWTAINLAIAKPMIDLASRFWGTP